MPSTSRYNIRKKRLCPQCHETTDQTATTFRYDPPDVAKAPQILIKRIGWVCEWCGNYEEEVKETPAPTDKAKIMKRLLSITDDYDVLGFTLSSESDGVSIKFRLPGSDMSELRTIQYKQRETGFITVEELIKVQRAGYKHPKAVPPKPQPHDVATLRKRERQQAFAGEPRTI